MKIIRYPVIVNTGIICQLIDQPLHVVGFVIDCLNIFIHLLRRVCHTVHDPFHIPLNSGNGRLQIVGYIADKLTVLFL